MEPKNHTQKSKERTCSHKPTVVLHPLVSAALRLLLLVLLSDLGRLTTHLSGTGQRTVNLT